MIEHTNKNILLAPVFQHNTNQDIETATTRVDAFLDEIYHTLQKGESITLKNFGCLFRPSQV